MLQVIGIKNCNKMRDTFKLLDSLETPYEFIDVKKTPLDLADLQEFAGMLGVDGIVNTKGTTYRKLSDEQKALDGIELLKLVQQNQSMIKRPLLVNERSIMVGFDEDAITSFATGKDVDAEDE
jgi:Spx/MgsR family transcriptional regulator